MPDATTAAVSLLDSGADQVETFSKAGSQVCFYSTCSSYGVATISRLLKIIVLFCRISFLLWGFFADETYDFKEPTNRSHPIVNVVASRLLRSTSTCSSQPTFKKYFYM